MLGGMSPPDVSIESRTASLGGGRVAGTAGFAEGLALGGLAFGRAHPTGATDVQAPRSSIKLMRASG